MFAVRRKVFDDLLSDSVWAERLENAETMKEVEKVITEFCEARGYRIGSLDEIRGTL